MRRVIILLFSTGLIFLTAKGQKTFREVINEFEKPNEWNASISIDTSYLPLFKTKQLAIWTLINKHNKSEQVSFFIFSYSDKDESTFTEAINSYYLLSSCLNISSDNPNSNFKSFQKGGFLFVMKMCPCSTAENTSCRQLAQMIFNWSSQ